MAKQRTSVRKERYGFSGEKGRPEQGSVKRTQVPVLQKGQEYDVIIEDLGHNGDGLVHIEEFTVFVPNTEKGEEVRIKIKKVMKTVAFADRIS